MHTRCPLVVYYSRTGHTKDLADEIAAHASTEIAPQLVPRDRPDADWPFASLVLAALLRRPTPIAPIAPDPARAPLVVVASPVWMGRATPPIRAFLATHGRGILRLGFALSAGRCGPETAFRDMAALAGKPPVARLCIDDADRLSGARERKVQAFAEELARIEAERPIPFPDRPRATVVATDNVRPLRPLR